MHKKIIGIFVCTLLIATTIPITGQVTKSIISKDTDEINPLSNGDKWMKTYGGLGTDYGQMVQLTNDGCYIVAGVTMTSINDMDYWLIKIDAMGSIIWDKTYDLGSYDWCSAVRQTSDDGFILVGYSTESDLYSDVWLIKTDKNGVKEWDKTYMEGDSRDGPNQDVIQTSDGGYTIISSGNWFETYIIRTDDTGNIIWDKEIIGLDVLIYGEYIKQTSDGGFIIAGCKEGHTGVWLIKLDSNGNILWDKTFESEEYSTVYSVQLTNDGGFIILGFDTSDSHDGPWLIKTDSEGELIWDSKIGTSDFYASCNSVQQTIDNGYIIAGVDRSILTLCDPLLIKTDSEGQVEWMKTYGDYSRAGVYSVQQTTDGGYIAVGAANCPVMSDLLLIKTNAKGNVARNRAINGFFLRFLEQFPLLERLLSL